MAEKIKNGIRCSFCGKKQEQIDRMISGSNGAYICNECVDICRGILDEEYAGMNEALDQINLIKPKEMKEFLDEYVIGQVRRRKSFLLRCITITSLRCITITRVFSQAGISILSYRRVMF